MIAEESCCSGEAYAFEPTLAAAPFTTGWPKGRLAARKTLLVTKKEHNKQPSYNANTEHKLHTKWRCLHL